MDDRLFTELLIAEVHRLRQQIGEINNELGHARARALNVSEAHDRLIEENERLWDEKDNLRARLAPYEEQERRARAHAEIEHQLQKYREQYASVDPVSLLPSVKGWTKTRKEKLVADTRAKLVEGKIPAIKFARDAFGGWNSGFGLKQAKDFVDCIAAQP